MGELGREVAACILHAATLGILGPAGSSQNGRGPAGSCLSGEEATDRDRAVDDVADDSADDVLPGLLAQPRVPCGRGLRVEA
ncbi:hypothetical protein CON46_29315, partial [Bacillus cereus]